MGIYSDILNDFSEMGSAKAKLRGKIVDLNKLLTDYSFNNSSSLDLTKQKIIVTFNEALEIAAKCSQSDTVRLYFPSKTVDINIEIAIKAAEYWIDFVLEHGKQFTNSLAIQLVERAEYDLKNQPSITEKFINEEETVSTSYPNFVYLMNEIGSVVTNLHKIVDTSIRLEYKCPILTYGRTMGYNHYILEKSNSDGCVFYIEAFGNNGQKLNSSKKEVVVDYEFEVYNELFQTCMGELMQNPEYLKIATKGF